MKSAYFQSKRISSKWKKRQPNGWGTNQPPENAIMKFLTPSRRHHPQVEPLLATYKICYIKRWLNHFGAFKKQVLLQKMLSLEDSWRHHGLCSNLHCCFHFKLWNSANFIEKRLLQNTIFPLIPLKTNLHLHPFIPPWNSSIFHFSHFPLHKILFTKFKNHF